uniref:Uncharacterized protein n=1 Tax=Arion vulgaris TaxID=1028688 RepID=A0A0B6Y7L6_9EUPU
MSWTEHVECTLCIILFLGLSTSSGCNLAGMQACGFITELGDPPYNLLFSSDLTEFKMKCDRQKNFLLCALQKEYVEGCSHKKSMSVYTLDTVHKAVCPYITAFNRSQSCFLKLKDQVVDRLIDLEVAKVEYCRKLKKARIYIRNLVLETEGCDQQDKIYLGRILDLNLIQYAHPEMNNCEMLKFPDEETTITSTTSSTTEVTTSTTTKKMQTPAEDYRYLPVVGADNSSTQPFISFTFVAALSCTLFFVDVSRFY